MKIQNISLFKFRLNGGGGDKAPPPPPPPAPPPPPPPAEDQGPDPAMQAEIEKQRALRYKAGQMGETEVTGEGTSTTSTEDQKKTTILGQ